MSWIATLGTLLRQHTPLILTSVGAAGVVTTSVMSAKAALESRDIIEEVGRPVYEDLEPKERFRLLYKPWIKPAVAGGLTIGCIVGAHVALTRNTAAALGLLAVTETAYSEYREKVRSTIGEEKERDIRRDVAQDRVSRSEAPIIVVEGKATFYDPLTDRFFTSTMNDIQAGINGFNASLLHTMYGSQNELYNMIGLPRVKFGDDVGWSSDELVEFEPHAFINSQNQPVISLEFRNPPHKI